MAIKKLITTVILFCCALVILACTHQDNQMQEPEADTSEMVVWTDHADCASCHVAEQESGAILCYSLHAPQPGVSCNSCHVDVGGTLARAHQDYMTKEPASKLKLTKITDDVCNACHSPEELKGSTAASTVLIDADGTVVNPHDLPLSDDHLESVRCSSCHKMHKTVSPKDTATKTCRGCHHKDVYECGTCHT